MNKYVKAVKEIIRILGTVDNFSEEWNEVDSDIQEESIVTWATILEENVLDGMKALGLIVEDIRDRRGLKQAFNSIENDFKYQLIRKCLIFLNLEFGMPISIKKKISINGKEIGFWQIIDTFSEYREIWAVEELEVIEKFFSNGEFTVKSVEDLRWEHFIFNYLQNLKNSDTCPWFIKDNSIEIVSIEVEDVSLN